MYGETILGTLEGRLRRLANANCSHEALQRMTVRRLDAFLACVNESRGIGTLGVCALLGSFPDRLEDNKLEYLKKFVRLLNDIPHAAARNKLSLYDFRGCSGIVYGTSHDRLLEIHCANATSALGLSLANFIRSRSNERERLSFNMNHGLIAVTVECCFISETTARIHQVWSLDQPFQGSIFESSLGTLRTVSLNWLNEYLFVQGPMSQENLIEISRSWLTTPKRRLAVLENCHNSTWSVRFWSSGGQHGDAPGTGLAVISFLREHISWLRYLPQEIVSPRGVSILPTVKYRKDEHLEVRFAPSVVSIMPFWSR
jgi:hypothetical protein